LQDSGTSFVGSQSREENIDRLPAETCELSLSSFIPSMASCTTEERELWPLINDQHHREYTSTNKCINIQDLQFESNRINLDLTIWTCYVPHLFCRSSSYIYISSSKWLNSIEINVVNFIYVSDKISDRVLAKGLNVCERRFFISCEAK
jgi:hypothetical protein